MAGKRDSELLDGHRVIVSKAANIANRMARERLLGSEIPPAIARRLASLSPANLAEVKRSWKPFEPDASEGFALRLNEGQAILIGSTRSSRIRNVIREIVTEAMAEAMVSEGQTFVGTMIEDLTHGKSSYYQRYMSR